VNFHSTLIKSESVIQINSVNVAMGMKNNKRFTAKNLIGIFLLWSMLSLSAFAQDEETTAAPEEIKKATSDVFQDLKISGQFNTSYVFRSYDGRDDSDLYTYFSLRMRDISKDRLDAAVSMFYHADLDGTSRLKGNETYDPFVDLDDAKDLKYRLYTLYIDIKEIGFEDSRLRLGRQFLDTIDYAHFDGASYQFTPIENLDFDLFGGVPITYYSATGGNAFYGANAQYRFSPQTKAAIRYYRYEDDNVHDDIAEADVWHMFTPGIQTHLDFSLLQGQPYLVRNEFLFAFDEIDLDLSTQFLHLFDKVNDHTINFNPYFPLLNGLDPFFYGSIFATKGITEYLSLTASFDGRGLRDTPDPVSAFTNRDYLRGTAGIEIYPIPELTLSVNGEYWDVDDDDQFTGITGEIEYKPTEKWTLTAGVDYGEYIQEYRDEFLYFFGQEELFRISPDVMTYYARVKWQPIGKVYTAAYFEYEDNSYDNEQWYTFRLQAGVSF
jgi:hypothetical protein